MMHSKLWNRSGALAAAGLLLVTLSACSSREDQEAGKFPVATDTAKTTSSTRTPVEGDDAEVSNNDDREESEERRVSDYTASDAPASPRHRDKEADSNADDSGEGADASGVEALPISVSAPSDQLGGTCGMAEGITITAGKTTSCGFAINVAEAVLRPGTWGKGRFIDPTVTSPYASIDAKASSPTTGKTYTVECNVGTDGMGAYCTGGNNGRVDFHRDWSEGGLGFLLEPSLRP